jgi:tryptophan 2,3-dioxygenase
MVTLENVLELANQLTDEQQEMLYEIVRKRLYESRRKQIIKDCHVAIDEFKAGGLKPMTAQEAIAALELHLNTPEIE